MGPVWLPQVLLHTLPAHLCQTQSWKGQVSIWPRAELDQRRGGFLSLVRVARGPAPSLAEAWITKATAY